MPPPRLVTALTLAAVTTLGWACLDFKAAYDAYCAVPGRCDAGIDGLDGSHDGGGDGGDDGGSCVLLNGSCSGWGECCSNLNCRFGASHERPGVCVTDPGTNIPLNYACRSHDQCGLGWCHDGICDDPELPNPDCKALRQGCTGGCCDGLVCRPSFPSGCLQPLGAPCTEHNGCEQLYCNQGTCAACLAVSQTCEEHGNCCSGNCDGTSHCAACIQPGSAPANECSNAMQCCNGNYCDNGRCCIGSGSFCGTDDECCSGSCNDGTGICD